MTTPLVNLVWNGETWSLSLVVSAWIALASAACVVAVLTVRRWNGFSWNDFEIDQAEIGVGAQKIRLKPNLTDRQVAYAIWVELSTRKIGLEIDLEHDVIAEIYDSWHTYFSVTRELIKGIAVSQVKRDSTQKIVNLSIDVLNQGLRPHLTRWQARFNRWYADQLTRHDEHEGGVPIDPQAIQSKFPFYAELAEDLQRVNRQLINYRVKMKQLVFED